MLIVLDNWESAQNEQTLEWLEKLLEVSDKLFCLVTTRELTGLTNIGETHRIPFLQTPELEGEPFEEYESYQLFV